MARFPAGEVQAVRDAARVHAGYERRSAEAGPG